MAGTYDIEAEQGATFHRVMTWSIDSEPVDLTGWTARMQVRKTAKATDTFLSLNNGALGGITLDAVGGVTIRVEAEVLSTVPAGSWVYDLELDSGSEVTRLLGGAFEVSAEVTR